MCHIEECLRFGFSENCPVCQEIEAKEKVKEFRRYRKAIPYRKF